MTHDDWIKCRRRRTLVLVLALAAMASAVSYCDQDVPLATPSLSSPAGQQGPG
jgi:hypothetical protein